MNKTTFGYSNEIQRYLELVEKSIPKRSFVIIQRGWKRVLGFQLVIGKEQFDISVFGR
jgi:hypothetical protein